MTMTSSRWHRAALAACVALATASTAAAQTLDGALDTALAGAHREAGNAARDGYRHPRETLAFFGLTPQQTVVELWPGRGWYTELLAPLLRAEGKLIVANFAPDAQPAALAKAGAAYRQKLAANPQVYGAVVEVPFAPPGRTCLGAPGIADAVLTFRNLHNWLAADALDAVFDSAYAVLRVGGVLGVVEHRAPPGTALADMKRSGYMAQEYVIERAGAAGFALVGISEINANPKDTKDYPQGVWTLPPTLRLGDQDRARYLEIGESDRMTLKFVKRADGPPAKEVCPPG